MLGLRRLHPTGAIVVNGPDVHGVSTKTLVTPEATNENCLYKSLIEIFFYQQHHVDLYDRMDVMTKLYLPEEGYFRLDVALLRKLVEAYIAKHFDDYYNNDEFYALMSDGTLPRSPTNKETVRVNYMRLVHNNGIRAMDVEMDAASELLGVTIKAYMPDLDEQSSPTILHKLWRTFQPTRLPPSTKKCGPQDLGTWSIVITKPFENGCQYVDASTGFLETAGALNRATGPSPTMESLGSGVAAANAVLSAQAPNVQFAVIKAMSQKAVMTRNAFAEYMQPYVGQRAFVAGLLAFLFASYLVLYMTTHPEVVPLELPVVRAEPLPGGPGKIDFQRLILSASPNASVVDEVFHRTGRGKQTAQRNTYGSAK